MAHARARPNSRTRQLLLAAPLATGGTTIPRHRRVPWVAAPPPLRALPQVQPGLLQAVCVACVLRAAMADKHLARQLREAAMAEQDPALREKLWEEYRRYKANGA